VSIDTIFGPDVDAHVWASHIAAAKKKAGRPAPTETDLAQAITSIDITDLMAGSSTIELTISDPGWTLLDSGFFDTDADGKLDVIDVNYPDGSKFWWRLTQANPGDDSGAEQIALTFMERAAVRMMGHFGQKKFSRGTRTRAQVLKWLVDRVGGLRFHSRQLNVVQPIAGAPKVKPESQRAADKEQGINPKDRMTVKGVDATTRQKRLIEIALDEANKIPNAPELAVKSMLCAGIGESSWTNVVNSIGFGGALQGQVSTGKEDWFRDMDAEKRTAEEAHYFLVGGRGYQGGGAIALANAHPDWSPGKIATTVEGSGAQPSFYERDQQGHDYVREAELMLEAYGGGGFGGTEYQKQFNFEVGGPDNPHEDYWDAANRLAGDVQWPFFFEGDDAYFDSEMTLIQQKPVAVIRRGDQEVISWNCTWDDRHIATEATLVILCQPLEFRAGQVLKLLDFGPASTGSTATPKKLPGRWLISEAERQPSDLATTFTLKQPTRPKKEPRSDTATRTDPTQAGGDVTGTPKEIIDSVVIPIAQQLGFTDTPSSVTLANHGHGPTAGGAASDHQGPPEHAWAADFGIGPDIRGGANQAGATKGDKLAKALQRKFDMPDWKGSVISKEATFHGVRYRFQLIWRYEDAEAGNHFTHVHFGVKRISKYGDTPAPTAPTATPTNTTTPLP
jgi:hypothetical protein